MVALSEKRVTFRIFSSNVHDVVLDSWREAGLGEGDRPSWVGLTVFLQGGIRSGGQGAATTAGHDSGNSPWAPSPLKDEDPGVFTRSKAGEMVSP